MKVEITNWDVNTVCSFICIFSRESEYSSDYLAFNVFTLAFLNQPSALSPGLTSSIWTLQMPNLHSYNRMYLINSVRGPITHFTKWVTA